MVIVKKLIIYLCNPLNYDFRKYDNNKKDFYFKFNKWYLYLKRLNKNGEYEC